MTSTRISTQKAIAISAICLSTVCLAPLASVFSFAPSALAQYGLGLPKSAQTGGATRGELPRITMLVPEDGAKTLSARPTFYWYISPKEVTDASATSSKPEDEKNSFQITFLLREGNGRIAKRIFTAVGKADQSGLYKFTLPETAPELVTGKVQRWQIRWATSTSQIDVYAPIRRDDDPQTLKAIAAAKNDLEKARIYAKSAYWYDAIDAYTTWLELNPKDDIARKERHELLSQGFQNHTAFSNDQKANMAKLITKLDESKGAIPIDLKSVVRRSDSN